MNDQPSILASDLPLELLPLDIGPYRRGNTGIDYCHRFDSGKPGPDVVIVSLTHGNEFCGAHALCELLEQDVRPLRGSLTLIFNNVAAYQRFDPQRPYASRCVDEDGNRAWLPERLKHPSSEEARRSAKIAPLLLDADFVLDLHSTSHPVAPMLIYPELPDCTALAATLDFPFPQLLYKLGSYHPGMLISYAMQHGRRGCHGLVAECGAHFALESAQQAHAITRRLLCRFRLQEQDAIVPPWGYEPDHTAGHYRIREVIEAQSEHFRFVRAYRGFERIERGAVFAHDPDPLVAPFDNCILIMPARIPLCGAEAVTLAEFIG
ncbi:succinylglutamate desuccinylase/aspartoacylase domain-containing protein [Marinobacterium aestuariivivens]|uniref:Succinylglutamate desuccinylase/aspartoacylase family protein n=1 Tax=Marinobacterium aestuariivivens TaxID=1698799 RepID=A0ABW1ZZ13_9GAMM